MKRDLLAGVVLVGMLLAITAGIPVMNSPLIVANTTALSTTPITAAAGGIATRLTTDAGGAPPLDYTPQLGTCAANVYPGTAVAQVADNLYCVNTVGSNSWIAAFPGVIDGRQAGLISTGDGTAAAQAALDAGYYLKLPVSLPISFNFTELAVYNNSDTTCGGDANPITRTADDSPGIETTTAPGFADNQAIMMHTTGQFKMRNCTVTSTHRGTNFFFTAEASELTAIHSYEPVAGYGEVTGTAASTTLTVSATTMGTVTPGTAGAGGPMLICRDCTNSSNQMPVVTSGSGPTYTIDTATTVSSAEEMALSPSWTWTFTNCLAGKTCKTTYPSAAFTFIGNGADNTVRDFVAGGAYASDWSNCTTYAPIGVFFDSPYTVATPGKPNHSKIELAYFDCAAVGVVIANASALNFDNTRHNKDGIGFLIGIGPVGTFGSTFSQPYGDGIQRMFFGFGPKGWNNLILGSGDGGQGVTIPIPVASSSIAGGNLWWDPGGIGGAGWNPFWTDGGFYVTGNTPSWFQITAAGTISTGSATITVPAGLYSDMNGWRVTDITASSTVLGTVLTWPRGTTTLTLSANSLANGSSGTDVLQFEAIGGAIVGGVPGAIGASGGFRITSTWSGTLGASSGGNKPPGCDSVTNQHLEGWVTDGGTVGSKAVGTAYAAADGSTMRKIVCYGTGWVYEF